MYYKPWCPRCEKPQRKSIETLNLIQALDHIETITNDVGTKEKYHLDCYSRRIWEWLIKIEAIPSNDSYKMFFRPEDEDSEYSEQLRNDIKLFCDTFNIDSKNGILLDISW